jgi:hypothetical protein
MTNLEEQYKMQYEMWWNSETKETKNCIEGFLNVYKYWKNAKKETGIVHRRLTQSTSF